MIALVDLGFMSARRITEHGAVTALSRVTDDQLTDELLRRLHLIDDVPVDELARCPSNTSAPGVEVEGYAANRRKAESEENDDDYEPRDQTPRTHRAPGVRVEDDHTGRLRVGDLGGWSPDEKLVVV